MQGARISPLPLYSGGEGEGVKRPATRPPHPNPLPPEYRRERGRGCVGVCLRASSILILLSTASLAQDTKKPKFTNRLAKETSPYLLMHAHNPTNWFPWGPEAFAKAKKEGKLVFLSIGYSSCYWCHVMERESFANEAVAKILNDKYVCIKVDREERPDIDHIYMTALQLIQQGAGGWPASLFLTEEGKPIIAFTYRHPEDREVDGQTIHGFKSILKIVDEAYREKRPDVEKQAASIADATIRELEGSNIGLALIKLDKTLVGEVLGELKEAFDKQYGGFGRPPFRGPKFPIPCRLDFLIQQYERTKEKELLDMLTLSLDQMAQGGIYDHLGGGFHRYTVERTWTVPHFEKMMYDNGQLVEVYAKAYRITKNPLYRRIVEETLAYVQREMTSPEGAIYSSQDAETHHEEGRSYVWTNKELDDALPNKAEAVLARKIYGIEGRPNFEDKYYILTRRVPLAEIAKELKLKEDELDARYRAIKTKLFSEREKRDKPFLNKIALTAWSGMMIAGYAEAGRSLKEPKYVEAAVRAVDFVLKKQKTADGRLLRTYGSAPGQPPKAAVNAYQEDYAHLVHGLLNLHEATGQARWLSEAKALTDTMIKLHGDEKRGGYYFTAADGEKLFARNKDLYDGAQPSGNSMAARNLVRLWKTTGEERYRAEAERSFKSFATALKTNGPGHCSLAQALDLFVK